MASHQSFDSVTLKIEHKIFQLKIDETKSRSIQICEKHRKGRNIISLSFEGAFWVAVQLKEAAKHLEQQTFFKKNKVADQIIWVNKHKNCKGQYMEVYKNSNGVGENVVMPLGEECKKWFEIAESIDLILHGGLKERRKKINSFNIQSTGFEKKKGTIVEQQHEIEMGSNRAVEYKRLHHMLRQ